MSSLLMPWLHESPGHQQGSSDAHIHQELGLAGLVNDLNQWTNEDLLSIVNIFQWNLNQINKRIHSAD